MGSFFKEFKEFAWRGNVMDMAVGVVIGGAFGKIVSSLVADVIMPIVGLLIGGVNFTSWKITLKKGVEAASGDAVAPVTLNIGNFIQTALDFLIIAFCIFVVIRLINSLKKREDAKPAAPAAPSKEEVLLTEIRDILKEKNS